MHEYLDPAVLAKIEDLELVARTVVEGFLHGLHRSPYVGFSVEFAEQRPLKAIGQLSGKVRSRVSALGGRLVLQNARSLSENRELMRDIAASWPREQPPTAGRVRLYDLDGFLVRDYLADADFTRKDILSPKPFHDLLCTRLDKAPENDKAPKS